MNKTFPEVIKGIRAAVLAPEVREDIAQMGEYVEQFANTATTKAKEAASSAEAAGGAVQGVRSNLASEISRAKAAEKANADSLASEAERAANEEQRLATALTTEKTRAEQAERELLAILRLLAAGNDAAMAACDRLEALWGTTQPEKPDQPTDTAKAVLGQAILGKMILGRSK